MVKSYRSPVKWVILLLVVALAGFADAVYMTAVQYMGELPVCSIIEGCDVVAVSPYSFQSAQFQQLYLERSSTH